MKRGGAPEGGGQLGACALVPPHGRFLNPNGTSEDLNRSCRRACASVPGDGRVEASSGESENGVDLLPCDWKLLDQFIDRHAVFEVLEDNRHGRASALEHPSPADLAGDTFH